MRCGCLPLEVELGQRNGTPLEEQTGKLCLGNKVEDEVHLLLECQMCDDLREGLISHLNEDEQSLTIKDQYCLLMCNPDIQAG